MTMVQETRSGQAPLQVVQGPVQALTARRPGAATLDEPRATPPGRSRRRPGLRLTRRGRILVVLVGAAVLFVAFSIGRVSGRAATPPPPVRAVVVHPGETLWQLAQQVAPNQDPRVTVAQLVALNHLPGPAVTAGEQVLVPGRG